MPAAITRPSYPRSASAASMPACVSCRWEANSTSIMAFRGMTPARILPLQFPLGIFLSGFRDEWRSLRNAF